MFQLLSRLFPTVYFILVLLLLVLLSPILLNYHRTVLADGSPIDGDEVVVFFPTYGAATSDADIWKIHIHGWVFEAEHSSLLRGKLLKLLIRSLDLPEESEENQYFRSRAHHFLVDNERGKELAILLGNENFKLQRSQTNGHSRSEIELKRANRDISPATAITFQAVLPPGDMRLFSGVVHLLDQNGLSIISDIDDTIKVSVVRDKKELLRNTFLREYQAVSGMAEHFREWSNQGASFHYVSASPWQLYLPLSEFLNKAGFPAGTFAMKNFRWKDQSFFSLFSSPEEYKLGVIEPLIQACPEREFVLVGDSGERDPEIYLTLAKRYPKQIRQIFIRDLDDQGVTSPRFQQLRQELPDSTILQLFQDASQLPQKLSAGK